MANWKISQLDAYPNASLGASDIMEVSYWNGANFESKKVSRAQLIATFSGGGGSNLGNADLTSTANTRNFALNGSLISNVLNINNLAGSNVASFRGDRSLRVPFRLEVGDGTDTNQLIVRSIVNGAAMIVTRPTGQHLVRIGDTTNQGLISIIDSSGNENTRLVGAGTNYINGGGLALGGTSASIGGSLTTYKAGFDPVAISTAFIAYGREIVAGNTAPHFRLENGDIIKLYKQSSAGVNTVGDLVTVLQNLGLLT